MPSVTPKRRASCHHQLSALDKINSTDIWKENKKKLLACKTKPSVPIICSLSPHLSLFHLLSFLQLPSLVHLWPLLLSHPFVLIGRLQGRSLGICVLNCLESCRVCIRSLHLFTTGLTKSFFLNHRNKI